MSGVSMQAMIEQMKALTRAADGMASGKGGSVEGTGGFGAALKASLEHVDQLQQTADSTAKAFQLGAPGVALSDVMIDQQEAGLALQMGVQVRNRLVDAYKQIMNMQV